MSSQCCIQSSRLKHVLTSSVVVVVVLQYPQRRLHSPALLHVGQKTVSHKSTDGGSQCGQTWLTVMHQAPARSPQVYVVVYVVVLTVPVVVVSERVVVVPVWVEVAEDVVPEMVVVVQVSVVVAVAVAVVEVCVVVVVIEQKPQVVSQYPKSLHEGQNAVSQSWMRSVQCGIQSGSWKQATAAVLAVVVPVVAVEVAVTVVDVNVSVVVVASSWWPQNPHVRSQAPANKPPHSWQNTS